MPADIRQYTDCENVIRRAQLGLPSGSAQRRATRSRASTPEEVADGAEGHRRRAQKSGGAPQRIGGALVTPGTLAFSNVSAVSELPTPLLVLIVLLLLGAVGFAVQLVRSPP